MARPRIQEVDYFQFRTALAEAADAGSRIEPREKERWKAWVSAHDIREAAFLTICGSRYEGLSPVIIDGEGEWAGYYLVSTSEEGCLKWDK